MLFSNVFSDMFDDMFDMPTANQNAKGLMNCDVKEYDDHYELDLDMAGFKKGDIKAELKDGYLTIKAERKSDDKETDQKGRVIRSERFMGTCQRTFYVGDHVKKEDVAAAYEDGVLKLNVPKKVEQPKVEESHYIDIQKRMTAGGGGDKCNLRRVRKRPALFRFGAKKAHLKKFRKLPKKAGFLRGGGRIV